jgi:hypothetical protein
MDVDKIVRWVRGAVGSALVWGGAWAATAFAVFTTLNVAGVLPEGVHWADAFLVAARFGVVGGIAGAAFSSVVRLLYRGRRISEINWVRFGIGGAVVGGVFVPAFMTAARLLSGDGMLPLEVLLTNGLMAAGFGGIAAAGSLKLAQRGDTLLSAGNHDRLDGPDVDYLASGAKRDP